MVKEMSPPPHPAPRTPSIQVLMWIMLAGTLGMEEDAAVGWAIPNSFPPTQKPAVDECESTPLVREWMSTGTATAQAALNMFDGMSEQDRWTQVAIDLKAGKKRNDGKNSHQFIRLDDEDNDVVVINERAIVTKDNRQVMGNKWEKARIFRDAESTRMSSTWTGIFLTRENKKEKRYKLMLDAQKKRMDSDLMRVERRLEIEREKIELEKQDAAIK
ncbi:putative oxidoreductase [Hordeum vulgare]|nr:putative oxidoreductase [Hordeum vulgare]